MERSDRDLAQDLERLEADGLKRSLRSIERLGGRRVRVDGADALDFASNDYLGLASDERLVRAARTALDDNAFGGTSARLIAGNSPAHTRLEKEIARYKRADAALLFANGYLANVGCIPALAAKGDVIFADQLNHASLVDGCRLSRAEVKVFRHLDLEQLNTMLGEAKGARRKLIVVDAVFSMDGDIFPLDELVAIAERCDAWTYVDDAHGTGVLGSTGRGTAELFDVEGGIDVLMGTLGKALGAAGAFVCGSSTLIDYLVNRARSFIFTTAPPPALSAAAAEAVRIVAADLAPREKLWRNCDHVRARVRNSPLADRMRLNDRAGHILPVVIGDARAAFRLGQRLLARGFLVGAVRPPTVPAGQSRLRITLSAAHETADIDRLLDALSSELDSADYRR